MRRRAVLLVVAVLAAGCTDDGDDLQGTIDLRVEDPDRCEVLVERHCLLPFPSDFFTVEDEDTATGRRVAYPEESMPANAAGAPVDPTEWNREDGFSPGGPVIVHVPRVDLEQTGAAPVTNMSASLDEDAPIVLLDADTGERHPYWAELDANATDEADRVVFVRPAVNLSEGHRYVVALRNVRDAEGSVIEAPDAFRAYRDRLDSGVEAVEERRDAVEQVFDDLDEAGIARDDLYLAWDFTVSSAESISGRLLHMRDDAFAELGDAAPTFRVEALEEAPGEGLLRQVTGTFEVPRYLTAEGEAGSVLDNGDRADGIPERNGTQTANFVCIVPEAAAAEPSAMSLYGHGLLGSAIEVRSAGAAPAAEANVTFCATDWIGMSAGDVGNVAAVLEDFSRFRSIPDRLQQGILNFLFLGRLMIHEDGLRRDAAFQSADGQSLLAEEPLVFNGNSQGGILGGAATAVAQDWTRAVLGVPGMNFSTLLRRSVDFEPFAPALAASYPDPVDQELGIALVQMLWNRGESNGYAHHITTDPYADTPEHEVLLFEAFGDHQVANVATEVMARTIGAQVRDPVLAPDRSPDVEPLWDIPRVESLPLEGSALVVWDFGTPAPPTENLPNEAGADPHGLGGAVQAVREMATTFLLEGRLIDVCGGAPCQTGATER